MHPRFAKTSGLGLLLLLLAPAWPAVPATAATTAWATDTIQTLDLLDPPSCGPFVTLNGFGYDAAGAAYAGWLSTSSCGGITPYAWAKRSPSGWAITSIIDTSCGGFDCYGLQGIPAGFAVDAAGHAWYAYGVPTYYIYGTIWTATRLVNLTAQPTGPGEAGQAIAGGGNYLDFELAFRPGVAKPDVLLAVADRDVNQWLTLNGATVQGSPPFLASAGLPGSYGNAALATGRDGSDAITYYVDRGPTSGVAFSNGSPGHEVMLAYPSRHAETAVVVGGDGRIHVAIGGVPCCGNGYEGGLLYLVSADQGATWTRTFVDKNSGRHPSIALGPDGSPTISYFRYGELRVAHLDAGGPGGWCSERIEPTSNEHSFYTKLTYFGGLPHVLYYDSQLRELRVATGTPGCSDGHNPTLAPAADVSTWEGAPFHLPIVASSPDGVPLHFTATGLPSGLAMDPVTGVIEGAADFGTATAWQVRVTATDGTNQDCVEFTLTVLHNVQPVAIATVGKPVVLVGVPLALHHEASYDPDGTLTRFAWTLDGVTLADTAIPAPVERAFPTSGVRCPSLRVQDNVGAWSQPVTVCFRVNAPPVAMAASRPVTNLGRNAGFDASGSYDEDGAVERYAWTINGVASSEATPVVLPTTAGDLCSTLRVTDNDGADSPAVERCTRATDLLEVAVLAPAEVGPLAYVPVRVRASFTDSVPADPAVGADVELRVHYTSGVAALDQLASDLGCQDLVLTGTTGANGEASWIVPRSLLDWCGDLNQPGLLYLPNDLGGRYDISATVHDAAGNHGDATGGFRVVWLLPVDDALGLPHGADAPAQPGEEAA